MDALLNLLNSTIGTEQAIMLGLFLFFLPIFFFAYWAVKRGAQFTLRPIAGYATLKSLLGRAAELGQPVHLSLGVAGIGDEATADTAAALTVLDYMADRSAVNATPSTITVANPTALLVAQDILRRAYNRQGYPEEYNPTHARFVAPPPILIESPNGSAGAFAYAAGVMRLLNQQKLAANVMIGRFGDEFLLLGETGAQRELMQIGGTSAPGVLPFVNATMTHPLIGEEIYAGGAYLANKPSHLSSLLAQDIMRWVLVGGVFVAIVLKTLGLV